MRTDFFSDYLKYQSGGECPAFFHRWSAIAGIGAYLERSTHVRFGNGNIYPNIYSMLIGSPGTRKSTAIKSFKKVLIAAGYKTIAASKTTKEKFMMDLAGIDSSGTSTTKDFLDDTLFADLASDTDSSCSFIMADEFNDFFGNNNLEFVSLLGSLWDWDGPYENRIKNGKSFVISNPTISILGGNTPTGFSVAFPPEIIGQGFFSRILLIYGEPSGVKIAFPEEKSEEEFTILVSHLEKIKVAAPPMYEYSPDAKALLTKIYETWQPVDDIRFETYSTRRFTHLLKLCMVHAAAAFHSCIEVDDVICANTVLTHTEYLMPKALGEFGKAKHSDVMNKVINLLNARTEPMTLKDIWPHVNKDLESMAELAKIIQNLHTANNLISIPGSGFLIRKRQLSHDNSNTLAVNLSYLTDTERSMRV